MPVVRRSRRSLFFGIDFVRFCTTSSVCYQLLSLPLDPLSLLPESELPQLLSLPELLELSSLLDDEDPQLESLPEEPESLG